MSESERRHGYAYNRILIETERILDPAFNDAVVFLSGAQVEMLRNITQYLNRQETYVTEYMPGYYIAPTTADYDDILEIVADLEETLMGNPNTIWGYLDIWQPSDTEESTGENITLAVTDIVPAGEVWVLEQFMAYHTGGSALAVLVYVVVVGDDNIFIHSDPSLSPYVYVTETTRITLAEGQSVRFQVVNLPSAQTCTLRCLGYKMKVPE